MDRRSPTLLAVAVKLPRNQPDMQVRATRCLICRCGLHAGVLASLNERLITIGVFVALALLAGYNFQASQLALIDTVAQAQIRSGR